jgi:hypothetical protein
MPVPKAPIDKYSQPRAEKDKVRFAEHLRVPAPAYDVCLAEQTNEFEFGVTIAAAADTRHNCAALCYAENVGSIQGVRKRANSRGSFSSNSGAFIA